MKSILDIAQDVLKHADIVEVIRAYLPLEKKGKNYLAVCPFHDDSNPSLTVSPEKQFFKCFVCGTGGNAITFVQKYEHISFFFISFKNPPMLPHRGIGLILNLLKTSPSPPIGRTQHSVPL